MDATIMPNAATLIHACPIRQKTRIVALSATTQIPQSS
jgi:hypothetical protein